MTQLTLDQALSRWALRTQVPHDDLEALLALPFTRRAVERDGFLIREGERPVSCNVILSGCAFRQKVVRNGARQILSFHFPGEFIDLQSCQLEVNDHGVQALGTCEIATVPKAALNALLKQRPRLAQAMWFDTLVESAIFREWVVNVGRRNARARIAHLLCELAARLQETMNGGDTYRLPLTQEHIADATGMTSVHTNRTIQALRKEGLISLANGQLVIHDRNGLRRAGDFSDLYLHRRGESAIHRDGIVRADLGPLAAGNICRCFATLICLLEPSAFIPRVAVQNLIAIRPAVPSAILHFTLVGASIFREWVLDVGRRRRLVEETTSSGVNSSSVPG